MQRPMCSILTPRYSAGDWFCSEVCSSIWDKLNATVAAGLTPLQSPKYPPGYTIQMLRGRVTIDKPNAAATNDAIDIAQNVLQESFDPIIDKATKENLLLLMTKAEVKGEYDYRGMYTALLSHEVCATLDFIIRRLSHCLSATIWFQGCAAGTAQHGRMACATHAAACAVLTPCRLAHS